MVPELKVSKAEPLPDRMQAMVLREQGPVENGPLSLQEISVPKPSPDELLIKVRACGVCRTDLHVIEGDLPDPHPLLVPGHQVVGVVAARGANCSLLSVGDRVGVAWLRSTCGECNFCLANSENLCKKSHYTGYHANGGYAEYVTVREDFAYRIPEEFSDAEATPLLCAGIIGYRALRRSNLPKGGSLGIFGFGSSAHITIQIALYREASVFVATRGKEHRDLALQLGATWAGDTYDELPEKVDSAIVFAPVGEVVTAALRSVRSGGTVSVAGIHLTNIPSFEYENHLFHEKTLTSVEANTRSDGHELLLEAAQIPIRPEVHTFPLSEANQVLNRLKHDGIKGTAVLIMP